ncbi:integrase catalytic domain-containing protein [Trichonephila clavipes]|nr:integrase catalytic domain-containing protein [Trichonephila clavipes]
MVQEQVFLAEIKSLQNKGVVSPNSKLRNLNPFIDSDGLLRVLISNLLRDRVVPDYPFNCSGVDFCGPFMISRRGKCTKLYSDNGKTFVGANKELQRFLKLIKDSDDNLAGFLSTEGIEWKFIPPRVPSFGGLREASVNSINELQQCLPNSVSLQAEKGAGGRKIEEGRKITDVAGEFDIAHSVVFTAVEVILKTTGMCSRRHGEVVLEVRRLQEDRYIVLSAKKEQAHHSSADESRFSLPSDCRRQLIWRESGTAYRPENIQEGPISTCSIMVGRHHDQWPHAPTCGFANGTMTGQRYIDEVLLPHVRLSVVLSVINFLWTTTPHVIEHSPVQDCLDSEGIQRLVWPAFSRSKPIENVGCFGGGKLLVETILDKQEHPHPKCTHRGMG